MASRFRKARKFNVDNHAVFAAVNINLGLVADHQRAVQTPDAQRLTNMMTEAEIDLICKKVAKGARLLIGRDHSGRQKIKLVSGIFGLLTTRLQCDDNDIAKLRMRLAGNSKIHWPSSHVTPQLNSTKPVLPKALP